MAFAWIFQAGIRQLNFISQQVVPSKIYIKISSQSQLIISMHIEIYVFMNECIYKHIYVFICVSDQSYKIWSCSPLKLKKNIKDCSYNNEYFLRILYSLKTEKQDNSLPCYFCYLSCCFSELDYVSQLVHYSIQLQRYLPKKQTQLFHKER